MTERRVVVTGMGVMTPIGNNPDEFWNALAAGRSGISRITAFDPSEFASQIAGEIKDFDPAQYLDRKQAKRMDRFCQLGVVAAKQALEDSGLDLEREDSTRIGVYASSGIGGLSTIEKQLQIMLEKGPSRVSPLLVPMMIINLLPGQIAMIFGLKGPNLSIVTACATSNHSIGEALWAIRNGMADIMVSGGAEASTTRLGLAGFCSMKALSTRNDAPEKASRPFDKERDGFIMSEGAGMVVLEELEHARARGATIHGEIIGYGCSSDAYHLTAPAPGGEGAARCMKMALDDARVPLEDVDYINAHGTSTPLNDKFETMAIKTVFGDRADKVPVSSTKSMHGHLLGATGVVEAVACLLAMRNNLIPPTINYEVPDPECDLDYVPNQPREAEIKIALNNSFGFGGHNATLILKRFE
ncbi:MAG: beta-ketoacyl-ACP synthase II [Candidatus Euphemobacter frigidus]|nr:beta-ketoacyl-ACP synthase II [Candidatus Euphemobacter frigidus]MDP8276017.1 beta-ketoacyl-ACP synthase II [Candidatus Euphemobacter frigidus]